jgi:multiple sugar transport system ATP-binding protein
VFVAAFIGSPSMNLVEARVGLGTVGFAGLTFPIPTDHGLGPYEGRTVILGIRPSDLADAGLGRAGGASILEVEPEVVEDLGTEIHVIFPVDAPPAATEEIVAVLEDDVASVPDGGTTATFTASLDPRSRAAAGRPLRIALDPAAFHFFDPDSGSAIASPDRLDEAVPAEPAEVDHPAGAGAP